MFCSHSCFVSGKFSRCMTSKTITHKEDSDERLAALIDKRAGTKSYQDKFKEWGDVNKAFIYWAERARKKLLGLRNQR
jgi:hypothetical protein